MEMNKTWPDIYDKEYVLQFQTGQLAKYESSSRSTEFKYILSWNIC